MVDILKNKYLINESDNKILDENENLIIDIRLSIDNDRTGQVKGTVRDIKNQLLTGVIVKIASKDGKNFFSTQSDEKGEFYFNNLPENKFYKIFLIFPGKEGYITNWFKAVEFFEYKELNFTLLDKKNYSIILGELKTESSNSLEDIEIGLFNEDLNGDINLIAVVRSNDKGEFTFSKLIPRNYVIKVDKKDTGYITKKVKVLENNEIVSVLIEI